jgi:hypothetical protein
LPPPFLSLLLSLPSVPPSLLSVPLLLVTAAVVSHRRCC